MKHLKKFNEELEQFNETPEYEFIDAFSQGIVEHGNVTISIAGEEISLSIEESNDGTFRVFLDDMDKKDLVPSEFDSHYEDELTNTEFIQSVRDFYEATTREKR